MSSFLQMLASTIDLTTLAMLAVFVVLFSLFTLLAKSGRWFPLRPIAVYGRIRQLASQATETGRGIHVALGSGQPEGITSGQALAGLTVLAYVARHVAHCNQPVRATSGNPSLLPAAQGIIQRAETAAGYPEPYTGSRATFYGPDPLAYAAGASRNIQAAPLLANVMVGRFGAEGLWLAEATHNTVTLGGTDELAGASLLHIATDDALLGEDLFAAGAYLGRDSHLGSLAAEDAVRIIIMISIVVGVVATSLGLWG